MSIAQKRIALLGTLVAGFLFSFPEWIETQSRMTLRATFGTTTTLTQTSNSFFSTPITQSIEVPYGRALIFDPPKDRTDQQTGITHSYRIKFDQCFTEVGLAILGTAAIILFVGFVAPQPSSPR